MTVAIGFWVKVRGTYSVGPIVEVRKSVSVGNYHGASAVQPTLSYLVSFDPFLCNQL